MPNSFDLQLQFHPEHPIHPVHPIQESTPMEHSREWISAFNTSLLTTRAQELGDRATELSVLMQTPEFASLLIAAQQLADQEGISKEEATERLIATFRRLDAAWTQVVLKRGIQSMIE